MSKNKEKTLDEILDDVDTAETETPVGRGPGRPTKEEAKIVQEEKFIEELGLTPEELETGEVHVKGIPPHINSKKLIEDGLTRQALRMVKKNKDLNDKEVFMLIQMHNIFNKKDDKEASSAVTKEMRDMEVDELKRARLNIQKVKESKKKELN